MKKTTILNIHLIDFRYQQSLKENEEETEANVVVNK